VANVRGKSVKAVIRDVADGFVTVNPLFLKGFEQQTIRDLLRDITKVQTEIRSERFPTNDVNAIRARNLKLQRLYAAGMVIKNYAKERRISLA
jgi:hypothetical protein